MPTVSAVAQARGAVNAGRRDIIFSVDYALAISKVKSRVWENGGQERIRKVDVLSKIGAIIVMTFLGGNRPKMLSQDGQSAPKVHFSCVYHFALGIPKAWSRTFRVQLFY